MSVVQLGRVPGIRLEEVGDDIPVVLKIHPVRTLSPVQVKMDREGALSLLIRVRLVYSLFHVGAKPPTKTQKPT